MVSLGTVPPCQSFLLQESRALPALNTLAIGLKDFTRQSLGEAVCVLQCGVAANDTSLVGSILDALPEEVQVQVTVPSVIGDVLVVCQWQCTIVVFMNISPNVVNDISRESKQSAHFHHQFTNWNENSEGTGQGMTLSHHGAGCNGRLQLRLRTLQWS